MKSFVSLCVLLAIGSTQGGIISPFYGYGYPGYATHYPLPALKIPEPEAAELKVETIEAPKDVPVVAPFYGPYGAAPYYGPYLAGPVVLPAAETEEPKALPLVAPTHYYGGYYAPAFPPSSQFHAQDEFGNLKFGYSNINSAKHEHGNTYGGVAGGYQYVDANGVLQSVSYVADGLGFRTVDSRLPVAPEVPEAEPLVQPEAPVFEGEQIPDTPEVAAAKDEFQKAYDAAAAAASAESE